MSVLFDTETTGIVKSPDLPDTRQPRIIEFFGLRLDGELEEVDRLHFLCNPGEPLTEEITRITGITDDMLRGTLPFAMHADALARFFLGEELVVGHNLTFDLDMLAVELKRLGRVTKFPWPPLQVCTVEATEHLEGRRLSLSDLHAKLFGAKHDNAHRAESDVRATVSCLRELVRSGSVKLPSL